MTSAARRPRLNGPAVRPASPKAEAFWRSLRDDLADLLAEVAASAPGTRVTVTIPADVDELSADDASEQIDYMLDELRSLRAELASARRAARQAERAGTAATASATLVADRLYETPDGEIYRTYESREGNLYVKIWTTDGWDYEGARGALRRIRPEHRMTVERAKELSLQWAQCIRCGAELSNAVSVERGIGPVCITKI
jgi:hypothetical protein